MISPMPTCYQQKSEGEGGYPLYGAVLEPHRGGGGHFLYEVVIELHRGGGVTLCMELSLTHTNIINIMTTTRT